MMTILMDGGGGIRCGSILQVNHCSILHRAEALFGPSVIVRWVDDESLELLQVTYHSPKPSQSISSKSKIYTLWLMDTGYLALFAPGSQTEVPCLTHFSLLPHPFLTPYH